MTVDHLNLILAWFASWWNLSLGAVLGSFIATAVERRAHGVSLGGRSHCACGRTIAWWANVPIIAWIALGGRSRCCHAAISPRYVITEASLAIVGGAAGFFGGFVWGSPVVLTACLVAWELNAQEVARESDPRRVRRDTYS